MSDPFSLAIITAFIAKSVPSWLEALRGTLLDAGKGFVVDQGKETLKTRGIYLRDVLHLDEKEQLRHLQAALDRAIHGGLVRLASQEERDRYRDTLTVLFEPGSHNETLRREMMRLFTLSNTPDVTVLNEIYNHSLRFRHLAQSFPIQEVDVAPYLRVFFDALIDELYIDPYFKEQLKDALQTRAALRTAASISDVALFTQMTATSMTSVDSTLQQMLALFQQALQKETTPPFHHLDKPDETRQQGRETPTLDQILPSPTDEPMLLVYREPGVGSVEIPAKMVQAPELRNDIQHNLQQYALSIKKQFHYFPSAGLVPSEHTEGHQPAKLHDLLAPQHIVLHDPTDNEEKHRSIIAALRDADHMVLLGGPGLGKSLLLQYLAWSHAHAYLSDAVVAHSTFPLLPGNPLPLYIKLGPFSEEWRHTPDYSFLTHAAQQLYSQGVTIPIHVFEALLDQGKMLLLFDGLDEVMPWQARQSISKEIERMALRYPGNHILVTSRRIGYDPGALKQFLHATLREFNDEQMGQLLHRWYTYLRGFSLPLPYAAQQEINTLDTVLRENPRLRQLAANPLLLTILIAMPHNGRLPTKMVDIYDRMAQLSLGTWSKLRGTNTHWKEMHMIEEDLYMCLAHLGFVFHQRFTAKDEATESMVDRGTSGFPAAFLRREIVSYLQNGALLLREEEQYAEADRFLYLVKMRVGLLVERGINAAGMALYGFVHRSFQEYFAALYIYGRFVQEDDLSILVDFLKAYLHDPGWQEIILLLLGKLKRRPVTILFHQLLTGQIVSSRSRHTTLLQQDLFFVSACLGEEIMVESQLAEEVILALCQIVKSSPLPSQKSDALHALHQLMRTENYSALTQRSLIELATQNSEDTSTSMCIFGMLNEQDAEGSEGRHISQVFLALIQHTNLSLKQILRLVWLWYEKRPQSVEEQRRVLQTLRHFQQEHDGEKELQQRAQTLLLAVPVSRYADKANAIQAIATLLPQDEAHCCIATYWRSPQGMMEVEEISVVTILAQEDLLPIDIRDGLYQLLRSMVPRFHQASSLE